MDACKYCHQPLKFRGEQAVITRFVMLILGDCTNPDCQGCGSTLSMGERAMTPAERTEAETFLAELKAKRDGK